MTPKDSEVDRPDNVTIVRRDTRSHRSEPATPARNRVNAPHSYDSPPPCLFGCGSARSYVLFGSRARAQNRLKVCELPAVRAFARPGRIGQLCSRLLGREKSRKVR